MSIQVDAIYQGGLIRPVHPLQLPEGSVIRLVIESRDIVTDPLAGVVGIGDGPEAGDVAQRHDEYIYGRPT